MFYARSWITSFIALSLACSWILYLKKEKGISTTSIGKSVVSASSPETTRQSRGQVRKDLFVSYPQNIRLQSRIISEHSVLTLEPHGASTQAIEELHQVTCLNQEKLSERDQQIRFLRADQGTYQYKTQTFQAIDASLSLYRIQGKLFPSNLNGLTPFLKGSAKTITLSIKEGLPFFEAYLFQASLKAGEK